MAGEEELQLSAGLAREIFTVSELNRKARAAVESSLGTVWVEGEISNLARPASGHVYFSLKDSGAQIRCAMFRQYGRRLQFAPRDGQQVLVRARASIYEARGDFQLIVEYVEDAGEGLLRRKFDELKRRLEAEGLFDASRKQPIPTLPSRIGVITSPTGAAIRDVLTALKRRFAAVEVLVYPSSVQGAGAAEQLATCLSVADDRAECDVLILTRGGGSLEDLWAFNEEVLARALGETRIPVIVGVGHETDFTIADFVADLRAPTPSQAAELAVPDAKDWLAQVSRHAQLLRRAIHRASEAKRLELVQLEQRLERAHPGAVVRLYAQRIDEAEARLSRTLLERTRRISERTNSLSLRIAAQNPLRAIELRRRDCRMLVERMTRATLQSVELAKHRLSVSARALDALSPLATLERGYAIVTRLRDDKLVMRPADVTAGEGLEIRLAAGRIKASVDETLTDPNGQQGPSQT